MLPAVGQTHTQLGFKPFDAAHLSSAEAGNADVFLTVKNPANWFIEINQLSGESNE